MATHKPKYILFAPLDWGLGHTTRCIPLIRCIQGLGHIPVVAGNASQRAFIEETFGDIDFIHLEGYNIRYSQWNRAGQIGLLSQMPKILKTIRYEHNWLLQLCDSRQIDGIISDNRYGLHHPRIPNVILTHQLQVQTGMGNSVNSVVQQLHYKFLNRFNETWVVDAPGTPNLAGKLSHPDTLPDHTKYIGLLSQFDGMSAEKPVILSPAEGDAEELVILLSGPEPQRSELSRILWQQVQHHKGPVSFIEGTEKATTPTTIPTHITYHKRLTSQQLAPILRNAGMVICRSGYSTLMDLVALRKKAILIPTPGQTEQEYLGKHLHELGVFYCARQRGFDLERALGEAGRFSCREERVEGAFGRNGRVLEEWVGKL